MPQANNMTEITIYTIDACPYSELAKELLRRHSMPYREVVVPMEDDALWDFLIARSGRRTMPQVFVGDVFVASHAELRALVSAGALSQKCRAGRLP